MIKDFTDLNIWKEAHQTTIAIRDITEKFSQTDKFGTVDQMRRSALSITSNIVKRFERYSLKRQGLFYVITRASSYEPRNQLIVARDINKINKPIFNELVESLNKNTMRVNSLIDSIRSKLQHPISNIKHNVL